MECGRVVVRRVDDDDDSNGAGEEDEEEDDSAVEIGLPELVKPGFSEFVMFEKQVGAVPSKIILGKAARTRLSDIPPMSHWLLTRERGSRGRRVPCALPCAKCRCRSLHIGK